MIQIRRNTFETNSSSSHSFVISTHTGYYTKEEVSEELINNRKVYFSRDLSFGRSPFKCLATFTDKLAYAIANCCDNEEIDRLIGKAVGYFQEIYGEELKIDFYFRGVDWYGGVDEPRLEYWLTNNSITLKDYLFDKRYIVICDGDEYNIWPSLKASNLIDCSAIDKEFN